MIVVLAALAESELGGLTDPTFIAALATLITALTGLIVAVRAQGATKVTQAHVATTAAQVQANSNTLEDVKQQTNGTMNELRAKIYRLERQAQAAGLPTVATGPVPLGQAVGASGTTGSSGVQ